MRNIIIIAILLFTTITFAQEKKKYSFSAISAGFDVRNAIDKGTVNDRAINFQLRYLYRDATSGSNTSDEEFGVAWDRFERLNFEAFSLLFNKVYFTGDKFEAVIGVEGGIIHRWKGIYFKVEDSSRTFWHFGANAEIRYTLSDALRIGVQANLRNRTDIRKFVTSGFFNLTIKL